MVWLVASLQMGMGGDRALAGTRCSPHQGGTGSEEPVVYGTPPALRRF